MCWQNKLSPLRAAYVGGLGVHFALTRFRFRFRCCPLRLFGSHLLPTGNTL